MARGPSQPDSGARVVGEIDLAARVRAIPGFPAAGVLFRDITPLLAEPAALAAAVARLAALVRPERVELVIGAEARGFILGAALARELGAGFVPARRPGRLPAATVGAEYELEYGSGRLELHADALPEGSAVLVHDDLLATGGTAGALCELATGLGARVVGCAFLIELAALGGRSRLAPHPVHSLITYSG